jgi:hypothetical protein
VAEKQKKAITIFGQSKATLIFAARYKNGMAA